MRMQELISDILDLIGGHVHQPATVVVAHPTATINEPADSSPFTHTGDDIRRFRQIVDLADNDGCEPYGNTPKEKYADIEAVTTNAGGGWMEPKNPSDIRGEHPSMYPAHQHGVR